MAQENSSESFDDLPLGQSIRNRVWQSGDITWSDIAINDSFVANGQGGIAPAAGSSFPTAVFQLREGDVGFSLLFASTTGSVNELPVFGAFGPTNDEGYFGIITSYLYDGSIDISESIDGAAETSYLQVDCPPLVVGELYALDFHRTADPSGKVYKLSISKAGSGDVVVKALFHSKIDHVGNNVAIFPNNQNSIAPILALQTYDAESIPTVDDEAPENEEPSDTIPPAYDTFTDIPVGQDVRGRVWDSGDLTWPDNYLNTQMLSDGQGGLADKGNDGYMRGWYRMRDDDVGVAVFFKKQTQKAAPYISLFSDEGDPYNRFGIKLEYIPDTDLWSIGQSGEDGSAFNSQAIGYFTPQVGAEYCLEMCKTSDASGRVFNYRITAANDGQRTALIFKGSYTAPKPVTKRGVTIAVFGRTVVLAPLTKVESLGQAFSLQWGAVTPPVDDGTTVTAFIGAGEDCHFPTIPDWWNWMVDDLVAANRSHVGLVDKSAPLVTLDQITLSGKIVDENHRIALMARPGHAYYHHDDFGDVPLRYDESRGAAIVGDLGGKAILSIEQDWVTVRGLQVRNNCGPGGSGVVVQNTHPNSSFQLNFFDAPRMDHGYAFVAKIGGQGSRHYGNFFVSAKALGRSVELSTTGVQFENCSFISAADSGASDLVGRNATGVWDGTILKNCAFYGWNLPYGGGAATLVQVINCITDKTFPAPGWGATLTDNIENAAYADQIINPTYATLDLRTNPGSLMYNAGAAPSAWNTESVNGPRVREGVVDIGAYESNRFVPAAIQITGRNYGTVGFTNSLRVRMDVALIAGETQTISLSDGADGTFAPNNFTLTNQNQTQTVVYTPSEALGIRTVTATSTAGTYTLPEAVFAYEVRAPEPPTRITIEDLADLALGSSGTFTVSTDNPPLDGQVIHYTLLATPECTFSSATGTLTKTHTSDVISFTPLQAGPLEIAALDDDDVLEYGAVDITVAPTPPSFDPGNNYYEVGTGRQFATLEAFGNWVANKDLVAKQANMHVRFFEDQVINKWLTICPLACSGVYNIHFEPAPGLGYKELASVLTKYNYPDAGIEFRLSNSLLKLCSGSTFRGFRLNFDSNGSALGMDWRSGDGSNAAWGQRSIFQYNRVKVSRTDGKAVIFTGERSVSAHFYDNIFIALQPGVVLDLGDSSGDVTGNTLLALQAAIGSASFLTGTYGGNDGKYQNNVFYNCGNKPWGIAENNPNEIGRITTVNYNTNFTNNAMDVVNCPHMASGITAITGIPFFNDISVLDLRPAKNGPLYGTASALAISTNDTIGSNRGYAPDAGALQLEPATNLGIVAATEQKMSGNRLSLKMSVLNQIDTLTLVLPIDLTDPAGAVQQGPINIAMDNGIGTVKMEGIPVGNYGKPIVEATNSGGSSYGTGFNAVKVSPIKTSATFDEFVAVADAIVSYGKPTLPIFGGSVIDKTAMSPLLVDLLADNAYVIAAGTVTLKADIVTRRNLTKVEFYRGATLVATQTSAPFTFSETFDSTGNGTVSYSVKVYDAYGSVPVEASREVVVAIPAANAPVPTVVSITAVNANSDWNMPHLEIVFSTAMDTSKDFDFGYHANHHLTNRTVAGTKWAPGSNTKLLMSMDEQAYTAKPSETLKLSYRKDLAYGWRSAAGKLVESFSDVAVTNNFTDDADAPVMSQTVKNLPAGSLAGTTWTAGNTKWETTTLFTSDGQKVVPGDASSGPRVNGGVFRFSGIKVGKNTWGQRSAAVSFVLKSASDSPYGLVLASGNDSNTSFGDYYLRAEVSTAGLLSFEHVSKNKVPNTYPSQQLPALVTGTEYTLRIGRSDDASANVWAVQFWRSVNGTPTTLVAAYSYQVNERLDEAFCKIYTVNASGPYASLEAITGQTVMAGGDRIPGDTLLANPAVVANNTGITLSTDGGGNVQMTGGAAPLASATSAVLNRLFAKDGDGNNNLASDSGVQAVIGSTVKDIRIGLAVSTVKNQVAQPVEADQLFCALAAAAIGQPYEVYVANSNRITNRRVVVTEGDTVRVRTLGTDVVMEVKKVGGDWIVLHRIRWVTGGRMDAYLSSQITLPQGSVLERVRY